MGIGCGPGQTTKYIHEKGGNVIGIDISSEMISAARELNPAIRFIIVEALVRFPYKEEYPSKRAYIFAEKG